jgi:formylglycine-generating enzyme required for sulfatase activity
MLRRDTDWRMDAEIPERLKRSVRRLLTGEQDGLAALAAEDWWMETFVQLAGLVDDTARLVQDVVRVNPWLAWWCVEEGRGVAEETREAVGERSVRLLESERVEDRRRGVAALAQIRSERVVEPLFRAAGDADDEVAGLAVQALAEMGEGVHQRALDLAQQPEHSLYQSGLAYVKGILGLSVVWVPAGPFLMGSDKDDDPRARDDELPQHEVTLPGYWIGRYPVTVAQYRDFVEKGGRDVDERSLKDPDDHPVRYVTWHDMLAYCRWLSERTGLPVMLPSEAEWEKAARSTDGRVYPWGDSSPSADLCNFGNKVGRTTPVGEYSPEGDSPYGCADMAGNVWEWASRLYEDYPYHPEDNPENVEAQVLRGGAFVSLYAVRCAVRSGRYPGYCGEDYGFRVAASSRAATIRSLMQRLG